MKGCSVRPINVLHLRDTYEIGGPGKTILESYRAIDRSRFNMHLAVFLTNAENGDNPFINAARAAGMPVHEVRGFHQYDPRMILRVARLARRLDIDIVHAHETKSDVITWLASALHRVPIITTMHGWIGNHAKSRFLIAVDKRVARRFDRVIAVSGPIRDELARVGVSKERLTLLHNAIVVDRYRRNGPSGFVAGLMGRRPCGPVIVSIGRLSPEKGHSDFVRALAIVASRGQRVEAVLVGDGPSRAAVEEEVRALGLTDRVHFPGYVDAAARILDESDLMVLPSHTEGLPNAALEALMMRVPVLATRVGGTPEVVTDGETGRLVPPRSPDALAEGILEFLSNRPAWARMAEAGGRIVEERFSFDARTRKLERIYAELVERNPS